MTKEPARLDRAALRGFLLLFLLAHAPEAAQAAQGMATTATVILVARLVGGLAAWGYLERRLRPRPRPPQEASPA